MAPSPMFCSVRVEIRQDRSKSGYWYLNSAAHMLEQTLQTSRIIVCAAAVSSTSVCRMHDIANDVIVAKMLCMAGVGGTGFLFSLKLAMVDWHMFLAHTKM